MNKEYIIINKATLQKRIEELRQVCNKELGYASDKIYFELEHLLSQSTPLIPEIEKAFNTGFHKGYGVGQGDARNHPLALTLANHIHEERQDYISNLKLDI